MKDERFFLILIVCGILGFASVSPAQTGNRSGAEDGAAHSREADSQVVKVYGSEVLTELTAQAILERRPDSVVVRHYKPLKNKVWIEGTTGSDYMPLTPQRVKLMQAARDQGGSVYSALCSEQKEVIHQTVGVEKASRRVERKEYRRQYYVRPVCPPPPPVCVAPVNAGFYADGYYPFYGYGGYGYGGYGWWRGGRYPYYHHGWGGYHSYHHSGGHYHGGGSHGGGSHGGYR